MEDLAIDKLLANRPKMNKFLVFLAVKSNLLIFNQNFKKNFIYFKHDFKTISFGQQSPVINIGLLLVH